MIGVDWGTSTFRAYRIGGDGRVRERRESPRGIMAIGTGDFAATLAAETAPWVQDGEDCVLLCGMIGSRQGWLEAPYLPCPAGLEDLAAALVDVPFEPAQVKLVPGLSTEDAAGVPEVMRGEETQIAGLIAAIGRDTVVCLPGTHSKWARVADGAVIGFETHMTGEAFAALAQHTILGRMILEGPTDFAAFDRGLQAAEAQGGLLHHLFGVRTLGLFDQLDAAAAGSYLSGLLIGHEVAAARPRGRTVHLVGAAPLCGLYGRAIERAGGRPVMQDGEAAARGLAAIGERAEWR